MNNQELIEAYLKGELNGQALLEVEEKISSDPEFASDVADHKLTQEVIHISGLIQTREKLNRIREAKLKEGETWKKLKWFMGGAALLAGLAGFFFFQIDNSRYISKSKAEEKKSVLKVERKEESISDRQKPIPHTDIDTTIKVTEKLRLKEHDSLPVVKEDIKPLQVKSVPNSIIDNSTFQQKAVVVFPKSETKVSIAKDNVKPLEKGLKIDSLNSPLDPCSGIVINATIQTEKSCEDNPTGKLYAMSVQGGKEPYSFSLIGSNTGYNGNSTSLNYFDNLSGGNYDLTIKDQNGCVGVFHANIASTVCNSKKNIFAPEYGESWNYPLKSGSNAVIRIFDSSGAQVFMVNINNGSPAIWDGRDSNFAPLIAGAYIYQITYDDGSVDQGSVTIVR